MSLDNPLRKRHAEHQGIARDLAFDDIDDEEGPHTSPVDMVMQSPRISPSCYRSPSAYRPAQINKSPCYRTIDGRTVQSKNPFSPMYTDEGTSTPVSTTPLADSLNFPVSLEGAPFGGPLLRHRLQKRETNLDPSDFPSFAASNYENFTRDGYPERKGRYSFTGSPIREMDFEQPTEQNHAIPHKVRRLSKQEDAPAAEASHSNDLAFIKLKPPKLQMDEIRHGPRNENHSYYAWNEDVSPTDAMSFPPLPGTPVPPTPSKPRNYRGRPKTRYTPVRQPAVPQTPMPERRNRGNLSNPNSADKDADMGRAQSRFYSDFDVIGELGNGSFGNVFKVMSRLDGCMYAIKVAHRPAKGHADKDRMLKEVYALAALSDQPDIATFHIVRYHQAWMEEQRLYIQTELCTTTLSAEIQQYSPVLLPVDRRYKFLREICLALEFIHKNGMVHLDIKPENIFIKNDQFKLGDFGLVSKVSAHDVEEGDSRYMSMELLSGDHTDLTKSDIFSLGISLYEICLGGVRPLPTNGPEWQSLRSANFPSLASTPGEMLRLLQAMMHPSPAARPSAHDLLKRPQLLSEEQKALLAERNKVVQANLALAEQASRLKNLKPPPIPGRKSMLTRANTWNGS